MTEAEKNSVELASLRQAVTELQQRVFILEAYGNDHPERTAREPWAIEHSPDGKHLPKEAWDRVRTLPDSARATA